MPPPMFCGQTAVLVHTAVVADTFSLEMHGMLEKKRGHAMGTGYVYLIPVDRDRSYVGGLVTTSSRKLLRVTVYEANSS